MILRALKKVQLLKYLQPDRVTDFCKRNKLQLIIRAHECVMDGFERFAQGQLITLFYATNYCGTTNNAGAILVVGRGLVIVPKLIHSLPPPLHSPETSPERVMDDMWMQLMAGPAPHTQLDADLAAGMGRPDNGPKLMSMIFFLVTINIKKGRSIIWFAHLLGCIIVGLMGLIVEIPLYTAIAIVKSPYLLFKGCQRLIHDLISREGPFLETSCIPIAGLTILMWPLIIIGSIIMAIFSSIFTGLYGSIIVYQELSFRRGLAYVIAMVAEFDEYTNDWLYLREGSIIPKPQYKKKILPSSDPSVVVQAMGPKQPNTGLFVGLNRGHIVTKKEFSPRPSNRKGKTSKRTIFVRILIRENIYSYQLVEALWYLISSLLRITGFTQEVIL